MIHRRRPEAEEPDHDQVRGGEGIVEDPPDVRDALGAPCEAEFSVAEVDGGAGGGVEVGGEDGAGGEVGGVEADGGEGEDVIEDGAGAEVDEGEEVGEESCGEDSREGS